MDYKSSPAFIAAAIFVLNAFTLFPASAAPLLVKPPSAPKVIRPAGRYFSVRRPESLAVLGARVEAKLLLDVSFGGSDVAGFASSGDACLTAGTADTTPRSIPACGAAAPQDRPGAGALELTASARDASGFVMANRALPTAAGLVVTFTAYSFDGTSPGADGLLFFMTDATRTQPVASGPPDFALGYARAGSWAGLENGYLGIGFDEAGNFSNFNLGLTGGWGAVPNAVVVRGSESTNYAFLATTRNSAGYPAGLPFQLAFPTAAERPANAPTVRITLTPAGTLSVAIDAHDGKGFLKDIPATMIVGARGANVLAAKAQPRVPQWVYIGFSSTTSAWGAERHQIGGLTVSTIGDPVIAGPPTPAEAGPEATPASLADHAAPAAPDATASPSVTAPR
jgi:hypothetical protein